jgi:general secretion pathway protein G
MKNSSHKNGFTLIELLVTIAIIGALSALLITNLVGARARAADAKKKGDLQQLKAALRLYYNDTQNYPDGDGLISLSDGTVAPGGEFAVGSGVDKTVYMKTVPVGYAYYSSSLNTDGFILSTQLGNSSDSELQTNYQRCCSTVRTGCPGSISDVGSTFLLCED